MAAFQIPFADDHLEGDAPTAAEEAFDLDVAVTIAYFITALDPENIAHDLAMGLNKLRRVARLPFHISDGQCEELVCAIYDAWSVADDRLPVTIDRGRLRRGMDAAVSLADWMKLTPDERRASTYDVRDALDGTLILECDATALSVETDSARRAEIEREARRTAVVIPFAAPATRSPTPEDRFR